MVERKFTEKGSSEQNVSEFSDEDLVEFCGIN